MQCYCSYCLVYLEFVIKNIEFQVRNFWDFFSICASIESNKMTLKLWCFQNTSCPDFSHDIPKYFSDLYLNIDFFWLKDRILKDTKIIPIFVGILRASKFQFFSLFTCFQLYFSIHNKSCWFFLFCWFWSLIDFLSSYFKNVPGNL